MCQDPCIVMDIDIIVNGSLDELFNYDIVENHIGAFPRWWKNSGCKYNGGFYKINPGYNQLAVYDKFYSNPDFWINHYGKLVGTMGMGEQNFVTDSNYFIEELPGQWLGVHTEGSSRNNKDIINKYYDYYNKPLITQDLEHNVVCVKWGDKFTAEHVNRLYRMVERNITLPFNFYCYTEDSEGVDERISIVSLDTRLDLKAWWWKLTMFKQNDYDGVNLYLDLDGKLK